jgi:acyl-lipid omega-6 desaturase (Delta-12 desaturase)
VWQSVFVDTHCFNLSAREVDIGARRRWAAIRCAGGIRDVSMAESMSAAGAASWAIVLKRYRHPSATRGTIELAITFLPFALGWGAMIFSVMTGRYWLYAALMLPVAGLLVRLFMIQHDCGHGSFFPNKAANDWTGRVIGVFTLTPYDYWRRSHAIHHATSGNLNRRGVGDIKTLTVREYFALGAWARLQYRLYRHPLVMFGLGPIYLFVLQHRLPFGFMRKGWTPWASVMITNAGILATAAFLNWTFGAVPVLLVETPLVLISATAGVWLFYVQHQFERTRWDGADDWDAHEAALHGSSHYDLPVVIRWFTANIGVHHVHHLSNRIPFYRLQDVLRGHPVLRDVGRITLWQSLACVQLTLWDEDKRRLVSFAKARTADTRPSLIGATASKTVSLSQEP